MSHNNSNNNSHIVISDDDEPMPSASAASPPKADADEVVDLVDSQPSSDVSQDADDDIDAQPAVDGFIVPDDDAVLRALHKDGKEALDADAESDAERTQSQYDDDSQANRDPNADPDTSTQSQVFGPAPMSVSLADAKDAELETESEKEKSDESDLGDDDDSDEDEDDEKDSGASKLDMKVDESTREEIPMITMEILTELSKANRSLGPAMPEEVHDDRLPPKDRFNSLKMHRDVLFAYQQQLRKIALAAHKKDFDEKVKIEDVPTSTVFVTVRSSNVTGFDTKLLPQLEKNELFSVWKGFYHALSAKIKVAVGMMKRAELEGDAAHKAVVGGALEDTIGIVTWLKQYEPYIGDHFARSERAVATTLRMFAQFEEKKADWKTFDDSFASKESPMIMAAVPDTKCLEDDVLKGITSCQYAAYVQRTLTYTLLVKCRAELALLVLMDDLCHPDKGIAIDRYAVYDPASHLEETTLRALVLRSSRVSGMPVNEIRSNISRAFPGGDGTEDEKKGYLDQELPKRQFGKCRVIDIALHIAADNIRDIRSAIDECGGCTQLCVSTLVDGNKDALRVQFPDPHLSPDVVTQVIKLKRQRCAYLRSTEWRDEGFALFSPSWNAIRREHPDWLSSYDRLSLGVVITECQAMTAFVRRRFDYARKGVIRSKLDLPVIEKEFAQLVKVWKVLSDPSASAGAEVRPPPATEVLFEMRMDAANVIEEKKLSKREREMTSEDLADEKQIEATAKQSALLEKQQQYQTHHAHFAMADADLNRDLRLVKPTGAGGGADSFITNLHGYEQIIERRLRARKRTAAAMIEKTAASGSDDDDEIEVAAKKLVAMDEDGDRRRPAKRLRRADD